MDISLQAADALEDAIDRKIAAASSRRTRAEGTVTRVDADGTVYVRLDGSDAETPASSLSAAARPGERVVVDVSGGRLSVDGNHTEPAVGKSTVTECVAPVEAKAAEAAEASADAVKAAEEAQAVADATSQHFFADTNGVHVTEAEDDPTTDHNILINSVGILLRKATNHLVSITSSAIAFFDGLGTSASNIVAQFGADGAQIGKSGESHMELDYHSLQLIDKEGNTYFHVSDLRGSDGTFMTSYDCTGDGSSTSFHLGAYASSVNAISSAIIKNNNDVDVTSNYTVSINSQNLLYLKIQPAMASGYTAHVVYSSNDTRAKAYTAGVRASDSAIGIYSFAEGRNNIASASCTHAEGVSNTASEDNSHAEGQETTASNRAAHSEGLATVASGDYSHAEGYNTVASGDGSHAEGQSTIASNWFGHAEGYRTSASGGSSHAQNLGTIAASAYQTALGKYNLEDSNGTYAAIIGNGTADDARSNAVAIDWQGRAGLWHPEIVRGTAPQSSIYGGGGSLRLVDKNGEQIGFLQPVQYADGTEAMQLGVGNSDSSDWNTLTIGYDGNDDKYVQVGGQTEWRNALGASSGIWPASVGGTGTTNYMSGGVMDKINVSTALSTSGSTWKSGGDFSLSAGTYIAIIHTEWASNTSGARMHCLTTSNPGSSGFTTPTNSTATQMQAANGTVRMTSMAFLSPSSSTTYYLGLYQNSGGNLNCSARRVRVIQLA